MLPSAHGLAWKKGEIHEPHFIGSHVGQMSPDWKALAAPPVIHAKTYGGRMCAPGYGQRPRLRQGLSRRDAIERNRTIPWRTVRLGQNLSVGAQRVDGQRKIRQGVGSSLPLQVKMDIRSAALGMCPSQDRSSYEGYLKVFPPQPGFHQRACVRACFFIDGEKDEISLLNPTDQLDGICCSAADLKRVSARPMERGIRMHHDHIRMHCGVGPKQHAR